MQQTRIAKALLTVFVISTSVKIAIFIREGADGSLKSAFVARMSGTFAVLQNKFGGGGHEREAADTRHAALSTVVASATEAAIAELKRMRNTILLPDTH